ncbi:hypothetical protein ACIGEP_13180 [Microbacterium sp. NPDC077663]|uniref:hypothetical protein n=1 Tax=Microbacterium sp. NPDC077663 TaxID=3364189 RepID=UPI0037C614B0
MTQLTYREAAKIVRRSPRTIRYWRQRGMPMIWEVRQGQRVRVVDQVVLLAWRRERMHNWPPHQYRIRLQLAELAANHVQIEPPQNHG